MNNELELLGLLQEECAEVIQIISKVRRFGYDSKNPYDPSGKSNLTLTEDEIGDVYAVMALLLQEGNLNQDRISARVQWKLAKLEQHWGYKLRPFEDEPDPEPTPSDLAYELTEILGMLRSLKVEANMVVPAEAAGRHIEDAIRSLNTPEPKPFKEALADLAASGVFDLLEEDDDED